MILLDWLRGHDSNVRPPGYEPDELPTALPRGAKIHLFYYEASELVIFLFFLRILNEKYLYRILKKSNYFENSKRF